jgi:putative endonuclease
VNCAPHLVSGREAEHRAALFLELKGIQIIERNYRVKVGEIDIVAREGETLIFVEVRWRKSNTFGGAIESVDPSKLKRMQRAAATYLLQHPCAGSCRLDVLCQVGHVSEWVWIRGLL